LQGGIYIVAGKPGAGKTILSNQIAFGHAKRGGRVVYATLLAETHGRLLQQIGGLSYFDAELVGTKIQFFNALDAVTQEGLPGLLQLVRQMVRSQKASLLVLDGMITAALIADSDLQYRTFIRELQTWVATVECTVLLVTSAGATGNGGAEHTMVDGIVELTAERVRMRQVRHLTISKFRGSGIIEGQHAYVIGGDGIRVFPRIESVYRHTTINPVPAGPVTSGIPSLDALLAIGGIPRSSSTVVVGSTGTGKTTMGLQFLAASTPAEPGLHLGFFEGPDRLRGKAASIGRPLEALEASGALELMWQSPGESMLDEIADHLLTAVSRRGVRRLVIDGLSGFLESAVYPERVSRFFSCLANELRNRQVTVLMTLETRDVVSSVVSMPWGVSGLVDNLFFLRFVHDEGHVERLLTIIKMRDTDYHAGLRRLRIDGQGLQLDGVFSAAGDVIPSAQPVAPPDTAPAAPAGDAGR
jgi:circadian clock protein KaiC